ncbi:hypothetical protein Taro_019719 [Colocasia esculenta]|uniref:Uncharacterized protein n=1 Tax=Colocasia esculenta TaxID=4460 RepID=A0A843UUL4_COLES|nr:hypothetical protein [Colocasia esculenta]
MGLLQPISVLPKSRTVRAFPILNMLHGRVEELLVAEELWNDHKRPFFFPFSSAATCTNHPLEVDQRFHVERFV